MVAFGLRLWLRDPGGSDDASVGAGFTLADLRALRDAGDLDEAEYAAARERLIGTTRGDAAETPDAPPRPPGSPSPTAASSGTRSRIARQLGCRECSTHRSTRQKIARRRRSSSGRDPGGPSRCTPGRPVARLVSRTHAAGNGVPGEAVGQGYHGPRCGGNGPALSSRGIRSMPAACGSRQGTPERPERSRPRPPPPGKQPQRCRTARTVEGSARGTRSIGEGAPKKPTGRRRRPGFKGRRVPTCPSAGRAPGRSAPWSRAPTTSTSAQLHGSCARTSSSRSVAASTPAGPPSTPSPRPGSSKCSSISTWSARMAKRKLSVAVHNHYKRLTPTRSAPASRSRRATCC